MSEGKVGCSEKVHDAFGVGFHPCSRVGRVERDGKWYCSQHDPCYVKKRREQRQVENQQQLKHQRIYSQVDMDAALRRAKVEGQLVWSSEIPKVPGWYWRRYTYEQTYMEVVHVDVSGAGIVAHSNGNGSWIQTLQREGVEWAGPIALPLDARATQIEEGA